MSDELDRLASSLFDAARAERAAPEVRSRVLAAAVTSARAKARARVTLVAAMGALAAGVAGLFWFSQRGPGVASIDREHPKAEPARAVGAREATPLPTHAAPLPPITARTPLPARSAAAPRPAASLSEELALVEDARAALAAGDGRRALALLDRYEGTLHGTKLRAEATILRIEALAASGRSNEAARLARSFVSQNPGSPLVDRARSFAGEANHAEVEESPGAKP
jgi:hypothetical protein